MARASLVLTSIFDPTILEDYYRNFEASGVLDQVEVILIPDRKSPESTWTRCRDITRRGLKALCPTLDEQEVFLARLGLPAEFVPFNSDNRRNVGYLMALERGCDFVISIDDDNYPLEGVDVFHEHAVVCCGRESHLVVESSTGFLNICDLLEFEAPAQTPYARGFPFYARHKKEISESSNQSGEIHINAGLWLGDPDIEAISWLVSAPRVTGFGNTSRVLGKKTWSPINTQNTALRRDVMAAYYYVRMGYPIAGCEIDRYGDIFAGYFAEACVKHLGGLIRVGTPVAEHRRNAHNHIRDATAEWGGILVLEELLPWLREVKLSGCTYSEAYRCLSVELQQAAERIRGSNWSEAARGFLHRTAYHMRLWAGACERINGETAVRTAPPVC
jgi:hypothetical protein